MVAFIFSIKLKILNACDLCYAKSIDFFSMDHTKLMNFKKRKKNNRLECQVAHFAEQNQRFLNKFKLI